MSVTIPRREGGGGYYIIPVKASKDFKEFIELLNKNDMNKLPPQLEEKLSKKLKRCFQLTDMLFELKLSLYKSKHNDLHKKQIIEKITTSIINRKLNSWKENQ